MRSPPDTMCPQLVSAAFCLVRTAGKPEGGPQGSDNQGIADEGKRAVLPVYKTL